MSDRITNYSALSYALENLPDAPAEIREKLEKMLAQIEKKNASPKKLTEKQEKNEVIKTAILDFLDANPNTGYTVTDLIREVPECANSSNQHISALVRLLDIDKKIVKYVDKRRTYVKIAA